MIDVFLDVLKDSLLVFIVVLIVNFALSFIESYLSKKLKSNKLSVLVGASIGLIPQCGLSIVGADLYSKKKISMGTILAIFIACSDEAIPILISSPEKILTIIPLLLVKLIIAIIVGYIVDTIFKNQEIIIGEDHFIHHGCCHHEIEETKDFKKEHIIHPLVHSLKILLYVFIINLIFSFTIYFIGEDSISKFLVSNKYLTILFSTMVGLIPNCASSIIICELYVLGSIDFAAVIAGLICNAGLGLIFLFKNKKEVKNNLTILAILVLTSLIFGYFIELILTILY